jgi:hypothetical protein
MIFALLAVPDAFYVGVASKGLKGLPNVTPLLQRDSQAITSHVGIILSPLTCM